ncbi:MAG: hypothetical protein J6S52_03355 [Prevotella sp.]|nr:hypothetical protein [Prevotella sp.]
MRYMTETGRKETMGVAVTTPRYDQVLVNVPHIELKKFKAVVKALGFTIEKRSELDLAIAEAEAGKTIKCNSLDELIKAVD